MANIKPQRVLLLGAKGYIGSAFQDQLTVRGHSVLAPGSRELDARSFDALIRWLREFKPAFVFNAAGYTGKPNVDACELDRAGTLLGNVVLAQAVAQACAALEIPWGHVSSGCIYSGAHIRQDDGSVLAVKDLSQPSLRTLAAQYPDRVIGFTEDDAPNFSFRDGPCSFYSGTKALGEEALQNCGNGYVGRLRIPFDHINNSRNYLSKIQLYPRVYDNFNSISHRGDFARACIESWELGVPFGTYNVTNPGFISTREVVHLIQKHLAPPRDFQFWSDDEEFYRVAAKTPRSNCVLDPSKLLRTGIKLPHVLDALAQSLTHWQAG